jgi:site-specific DNA-methyltransferase (adenine-specific)
MAPHIEIDHIYLMDCREGMKAMRAGCVDLIVTDPPFAIDFRAKRSNYNRTHSRVLEGYNEIPKEEYYEFTLSWMREAYRVLKDSGSMYVFSGWNNLRDILNAHRRNRIRELSTILYGSTSLVCLHAVDS